MRATTCRRSPMGQAERSRMLPMKVSATLNPLERRFTTFIRQPTTISLTNLGDLEGIKHLFLTRCRNLVNNSPGQALTSSVEFR
jgi:hypothetical protein